MQTIMKPKSLQWLRCSTAAGKETEMRKMVMLPGLLLALAWSTVVEANISASEGRFSCRASAGASRGQPESHRALG